MNGKKIRVRNLREISERNLYLFDYNNKHFLYSIHGARSFSLSPSFLHVLKQVMASDKTMVSIDAGTYSEETILDEYSKLRELQKEISMEVKNINKIARNFSDFYRTIDNVSQLNKWHKNVVRDNYVYLTRKCNLACSYCWNEGGKLGAESPPEPTAGLMEKTADFIIANSGSQDIVRVIFFGGEPFMNIPMLKHFVLRAEARADESGKKIAYLVNTNGTIWNRQVEALALKYNFHIVVSIDGREETHNAHRRFRNGRPSHSVIVRNIRKMVKSLPERVGARAILGDCRFSLKDTYDYFRKFGLGEIQAFYHLFSGYDGGAKNRIVSMETIENYRSELGKEIEGIVRGLKKQRIPQMDSFLLGKLRSRLEGRQEFYRCFPGATQLVFQTDGSIYPCLYLNNEKYRLGDVNAGIQRWDIMQSLCRLSVFNQKKCTKCWARYSCGGCCTARSISFMGKPDRPVPVQCERTKEEMRALTYLLAEIYSLDITLFNDLVNASVGELPMTFTS